MRNRFIKSIFALVAALLAGLTLAACNSGDEQKPYDFLVTFNYNVGNLDANCPDQYLGVKSGGKISIQPGYNEAFQLQEVIDHYNDGWFLPQMDADGNPVVGEDGRVLLDREWNFAVDTVSSDITLYANLRVKPSLIVKVDGGEDVIFKGNPGAVRQRPSAVWEPVKEGWTFYDYFVDPEFKTPFSWPYTFTDENTTIYAKFIEGDWTIVKSAREFADAVGVAGAKVYVDNDLDFSETSWKLVNNFTGTIEGNGHKITGVEYTFNVTNSRKYFGLFVSIGGSAVIRDIEFVDVKTTFNTSFAFPCGASLFADSIADGASIVNVKCSGTLTKGRVVDGAAYDLFGFCRDYNRDRIDLTGSDFDEIVVVDEA